MDHDQKRAVELATTGISFFLTGAGGTGKSYVIRSIVEALQSNGRDCALTAMTGCAALLLGKGAKTLHSWSGIGLGKEPIAALLIKIRKSSKAKKNWLAADALIIDEVSMLTPDLLDKLDEIGRKIRKCADKPFGGLQVILVGDLFQLPPINKDGDQKFVFESEIWKTYIKDIVNLRTIHRQSDEVFLKILDEARHGELSEESIEILEARKTNEWKRLEIKPTLLFTKKDAVEEINMGQLKKCPGEDIVYKVKTVYTPAAFAVKPTEQEVQREIDRMDKVCPYMPELRLRVGAQVMLLTNKHAQHGLVNGSRGIVEKICDGPDPLPMVKFRNGEVLIIEPSSWASDEIDGFNREQIPLSLAYAVTIHKAQGATLDCALIDIGSNTFEYGQAYVALSRVRSLDCLYIWDLNPSAFRVHPKVKAFFDQIPLTTSDQTSDMSTACIDETAAVSDALLE
jgi:ATP-dependent DNA helicase PIF1